MAQLFTLTAEVHLETEVCYKCGCTFAMPANFRRTAQNNPSLSFFCPSGHEQSYVKSKEQRLREEAEARLLQVDAQRIKAENELAALKRKAKRKSSHPV